MLVIECDASVMTFGVERGKARGTRTKREIHDRGDLEVTDESGKQPHWFPFAPQEWMAPFGNFLVDALSFEWANGRGAEKYLLLPPP